MADPQDTTEELEALDEMVESDCLIDVDMLVGLGYMQDFGLGYPEWT